MFATKSRLQELLKLGLSLLALAAGLALSGYAPAGVPGFDSAESATEIASPPVTVVIGGLHPVTAELPSDCPS